MTGENSSNGTRDSLIAQRVGVGAHVYDTTQCEQRVGVHSSNESRMKNG